jgi:hypothetical protein
MVAGSLPYYQGLFHSLANISSSDNSGSSNSVGFFVAVPSRSINGRIFVGCLGKYLSKSDITSLHSSGAA